MNLPDTKRLQPFFTIRIVAVIATAAIVFHSRGWGQDANPAPKNLSTLQFEYQVFFAELNKPLNALGKRYAALLQKQEGELIAAGNTEGAKILRKEIEYFEVRKVEIPQALAEARRLQGIYDRERLPLARERSRKARLLMERYRQNLEALRPVLVKLGNTGDVEKIDAEGKALQRTRRELTAAAAPGRRSLEAVPVFEDRFETGKLGKSWTIQSGGPSVSDGKLRALDNGTVIETPLGFLPGEGFTIEVDLEKRGENHHSEWDFEIVIGGITGRFLFDSSEGDQLALLGDETIAQSAYPADSPNRGKVVMAFQDEKFRLQFTNDRGRKLDTGWCASAIRENDPRLRIRIAGGGEDSPRLIDNVRIFDGTAEMGYDD